MMKREKLEHLVTTGNEMIEGKRSREKKKRENIGLTNIVTQSRTKQIL